MQEHTTKKLVIAGKKLPAYPTLIVQYDTSHVFGLPQGDRKFETPSDSDIIKRNKEEAAIRDLRYIEEADRESL